MFVSNKLSNLIVNKLLDKNIITLAELPHYRYSFDFTLDLIIFNISLILIGFILKSPFLSILYVFTFAPIKMLSGGAHAWNRIACSIISYSIFLFSILTIKFELIKFSSFEAIFIYMIGSLLLLILAPVDCKTKRIPKEKRGYYKKRLFLLLVVFGIILSFYLYKNQHNFFSLLTLCIIIIVINEIIGILINQQSK